MSYPDFAIIGAMKCGTSTLAAQLGAQDGVFMTTPKEPNFFSDDLIYAKGMGWYEKLYADAAPGTLKGEASTHYTKSPTWPKAAGRLHMAAPEARLIYVMRDPVERIVSQYIHMWSMGEILGDLEGALHKYSALIDYSRYCMQIRPWVERFGEQKILLLRMEDFKIAPEAVLERTGAFLGQPDAFRWRYDLVDQNVSAERIRRFPGFDLLINHPAAAKLRRRLVPRRLRSMVRSRLQMRQRPQLSEATRARLTEELAADIDLWLSAAISSH